MPKSKKKIKPCQIFEYKLTLKTYGEPIKFYGFKDIIRRIFRESIKNTNDWKPTKPYSIAKKESYCAICLNDIHKNQHVLSLSCNHQFHRTCFMTWCSSKCKQDLAPKISCPMCRELQQITYKQHLRFVAVTSYSVDDQDTLLIERNVIPEDQF
jgi:hypothetical protein